MANPVKGAVGTVFEITVLEDGAALDISSATGLFIDFLKPDATVLPKAAAFTTDGVNGKLQASLSGTELNLSGVWRIQARLTLGAYNGPTAQGSFVVTEGI